VTIVARFPLHCNPYYGPDRPALALSRVTGTPRALLRTVPTCCCNQFAGVPQGSPAAAACPSRRREPSCWAIVRCPWPLLLHRNRSGAFCRPAAPLRRAVCWAVNTWVHCGLRRLDSQAPCARHVVLAASLHSSSSSSACGCGAAALSSRLGVPAVNRQPKNDFFHLIQSFLFINGHRAGQCALPPCWTMQRCHHALSHTPMQAATPRARRSADARASVHMAPRAASAPPLRLLTALVVALLLLAAAPAAVRGFTINDLAVSGAGCWEGRGVLTRAWPQPQHGSHCVSPCPCHTHTHTRFSPPSPHPHHCSARTPSRMSRARAPCPQLLA
jgi:hypothetical protein